MDKMFTGIVTDLGYILDLQEIADNSKDIIIATHYDIDTIDMGASIACAGTCLTVVDKGFTEDDIPWFMVEASPETLNVTTIQYWQQGVVMNLERALKVGEELGGHMVLGHVDGMAKILDIQEQGNGRHVIFSPLNTDLLRYIAHKGSICLDGVSLTVNKMEGDKVHVMIIPHTWEHTTFQYARPGIYVNMEVDVVSRYVEANSALG